MCGRYALIAEPDELAELFRLTEAPELRPRYNIAPTQQVAALRLGDGGRELARLRWGLIPSWAKDPSIGSRLINARSETAHEKPAFRSAFRRRRCLLAASGFYEWRRDGSRKQPYLIRLAGGAPFAMAGLWEHWRDPEGEPLETCTILTTGANELVRPLHDRMPVIVAPEDHEAWLDPNGPDPRALLRPYPAEAMEEFAVSTRVNSPRNDDPECVAPLQG